MFSFGTVWFLATTVFPGTAPSARDRVVSEADKNLCLSRAHIVICSHVLGYPLVCVKYSEAGRGEGRGVKPHPEGNV